nr:glycoside hydrolase family 38 C-terminal domain-containing protein [Candidatus Njordarchaeum guaymaensis]
MGFLKLEKVEPTVFFLREKDELRQLVELTIRNEGKEIEANIEVQADSVRHVTSIGRVETGTGIYKVPILDIQQSTTVRFRLYAAGELQDESSLAWKPQRHWLVYVIQRAHHDPAYTDLIPHVLEEYNGFYDQILKFCDETSDWPEESKFRFQVETSWSVLNYMKNRPKAVVDRLIGLMKERRIEVGALYANEVTALCSHEELIRLLYPTFQLKREYRVPIKSAELNDIPGASWGLSNVLANSGVKYLIVALPRWYFGKNHPNWDEKEFAPHAGPRAFYWLAIDGSKVLFWYGKYGWDSAMFFANDYEQTYKMLPGKLKELEDQDYLFDAATFRVQGGHRDNSPPTIMPSYIAKEWNERWAYPKIIVGTNSDFFDYIESKYGDELPTYRGEIPCTDYVLGATSTPLETGVNRVTHERLMSAEKFCTIASSVTDYHYPHDYLTKAYENTLMYDEHAWAMHDPIGPAQDSAINTKCGFAYMASALTQDCLSKSLNKIVDQVNLPSEGYHIIVFNPLSWKRTDIVYASFREPTPCGFPMHTLYELPEDWMKATGEKPPILVAGNAIGRNIVHLPLELLDKPFNLIDEDARKKVPYQIIEVSDPQAPTPMAGHRYALAQVDRRYALELVFVASDVPPLGYKTYGIAPSDQKTDLATNIKVGDASLENRFYRISVNPRTGTITSIYDRELNIELVDKDAPHGFNQFLVREVTNGEQHPALESKVQKGKTGPVIGSLIIKGTGVGCPQRTQEIIIYDNLKRIDIANRILKDSTPLLEMYFAYPFDMKNPKAKFEATDSLITPIEDQIPGSNTDYYTVQHWADVSNGDYGVTWTSIESHLAEFGGLWPGYLSGAHHGVTYPGYGHEWLKPGEIKKGHIYSYVMNSNYRTNFQPTQVSDLLFRYSLSSHSGGWMDGEARDFGWGAQNPLIPVSMKGKQEGSLPQSTSFCSIDRSNIILANMKTAEDSDGIILRLMETEAKETTATITLPFVDISEAYLTNLVEENETLLSSQRHTITVPLKAFSISALRVKYCSP